MSRYSWSELKTRKITDGSEYNIDSSVIKHHKIKISHLNCEYCEKEIIGVWDDAWSKNWYPYIGTQAAKPHVYKYSPAVQAIKEFYSEKYNKDFTKETFHQEYGNNMMNSHARLHSKDWSYRVHSNSMKMLCNECFIKTYNRWRVQILDSKTFKPIRIDAVSVVQDRGETIESIIEEFNIKHYKVLGRGAKYE